MSRKRLTLKLKRWLAAIGALVVMGGLGGLVLVTSFAIRETGRGANPNMAFSPTGNVPDALAADLARLPDADDLVRVVEPTTRAQLGSTPPPSNDSPAADQGRIEDGDAPTERFEAVVVLSDGDRRVGRLTAVDVAILIQS
ncbi:MAG: hypothetical protein ACI8RE_001340 [Ilumatobacter sp.]|jgi:hypothetical protein